MKTLLVVLTCLALQGCWFVFIPGSLINAVSDSLTGSEGSHCIVATARVGDVIKLTNGSSGVVKSLSGTSVRCTDPAYPVRALLI